MPTKNGTTKKSHRYNFGRLRIFIIVGALVYVIVFMVNHQGDVAAQTKRQAELLQRQTDLEQQVQYYSNELDYIGTDEYVEQEARNRFGWLKSGEIKYMEGNATGAGQASAEPTADQGMSSDVSADPDAGERQTSEPTSSEGITASGDLSD